MEYPRACVSVFFTLSRIGLDASVRAHGFTACHLKRGLSILLSVVFRAWHEGFAPLRRLAASLREPGLKANWAARNGD